jgi:glycosyltransferase involved in cell wall biosynthesis
LSFSGKVFYFVQDFEPMFGAVGSDYMRALATYSMDFTTICYGRWVAARLEHEVDVRSHIIPFAMDHQVYCPLAEDGERDIDILFFARKSQERRCFSLIMDGLRLLKIARPSTRIALFGENSYSDVGFEHENFGLISDLASLADIYRRTKAGICFSTTNPSQLGYEMIACGSVLVDVRTKFCDLNFDGENFVKYCVGTPESLARACLELLNNPQDLARRRALGEQFASAMPSDDDIGREFIRLAGLYRDTRCAA